MAYQRVGCWHSPGQTQTAATAIIAGIEPYRGTDRNLPLVYAVDSQGTPNWIKHQTYTVVQNYSLLAGSTRHDGVFMRPLNYSIVTIAGASAGSTFTIDKDPGLYTTAANWRWGTTTPKGLATNAIAANDYFAVQLTDGTWFFDKVSSVTSLAITVTTTLPTATGGGIAIGAVCFWFGISTDLDPRQGAAGISNNGRHPLITCPISTAQQYYAPDGLLTTIGPGEPILYYNGNGTAADFVSFISGFYGKQV